MAAIPGTTRRPRRTAARRTGRRRLPALGWWWLAAAATAFGVIKTWPLISGTVIILTAVLLILRAIRPTRLTRLWNGLDKISERRRALPRNAVRPLRLFQQMSPDRFERAITELAREHPSVHHAQHVGQANDRGADVLVRLKDGRRILIQCKRYRAGNNIGSETVQTINGVYRDIHQCNAAVIITTAGFTRAAVATNAMLPQPIRLIDGHGLTAWANGGPTPW